MPKLNKPRTASPPSESEARKFLTEISIDPTLVVEARHSSDGSLLVLTADVATIVEFNPALATQIVVSLKALGIKVVREI